MTTLREAAQQALEALGHYATDETPEGWHAIAAITALRAALAEPDLNHCPNCGGIADNGHDRSIPPNPYWCSKCTAEPAEPVISQEQLSKMFQELEGIDRRQPGYDWRRGWNDALLLAMDCCGVPTPRKPLTDEEIEDVINNMRQFAAVHLIAFARAIEAAHGITDIKRQHQSA